MFAGFGFDFDAMTRLLTLMMILMLVLVHGSSVAAAICRHRNGGEHVAALHSLDLGIRAKAHNEETAANATSRKGAPADSVSVSWPSDMLPATSLPVPFRAREAVERHPVEGPVLVGASIRPLLEPPST
jgi:hypothetical protein